ncbi:MAG: hypothetical protein EOO01_25845, partial [Chitinophagaceae bacterium]
MPKVVVKRPKERVSLFRHYKIYINDDLRGEIANNSTKEFDLPVGEHTLYFRIDWLRSKKIVVHLDEKQTTLVDISFHKSLDKFFHPALIISLAAIFLIEPFYDLGFLWIVLLAPSFLVMLYILIIRKDLYFSVHVR